ncbi:MAG: class D sortase [Lachnospiraceae bacterium]|nr:class D sortase [Lachnospiraceae bacterium]
MKRKWIAGILIVAGLAIMSVPLYWRITGNYRNQQMVKEMEQIIEQETENEEKEDHGQTAPEAAISEEDAAALSKEEVIGLIEIEALDIKYAVLEGAGSYELSCGIGHISDTAGIGEVGNCVLAGHNGSRHGTYFTNLKTLKEGDVIKLTDKKGNQYFYVAESMKVVGPYDNSVKDQGDAVELTLLTCENSGTMRLVVSCTLSEVKQSQNEKEAAE